jgi:hypothetical protein
MALIAAALVASCTAVPQAPVPSSSAPPPSIRPSASVAPPTPEMNVTTPIIPVVPTRTIAPSPSTTSPLPMEASPSSAIGGGYEQAQQTLDHWASVVGDDASDAVIVTTELATQDHGWSGPTASNDKRALYAGLLESEVDVPTSTPPAASVEWPDGSSTRVTLMPASAALDALRTENVSSCPECTPVHIVGIDLVTHVFDTARGPASLPTWRFSLRESGVHVFRLAVEKPIYIQPTQFNFLISVTNASDSNVLTVHFLGGECDPPYHLEAVESDLAVVVLYVPDAQPTPGICSAVGVFYTSSVKLSALLGTRTVLDIFGTPTSRDATRFSPGPEDF